MPLLYGWSDAATRPRKPTKADYVLARQCNRGVLPLVCRRWLAGERP